MRHAKRWYSAHRERLARLGWVVAEAAISAGIGLLAVTLWLRSQ